MTYYNYVRRDKESQVDWGGITEGITGGLKEVSRQRQEKRRELDEINDDLVRSTNDVEIGQSKSYNEFVLDGANQTKQFLLMQNRLLKRGLLDPNDYSRSMQNSKDSWRLLSKTTKQFNEIYSDAMDRLNKGEMSAQEQAEKEAFFQFGNVKDKSVYINPVDGNMYIAKRGKDGKLVTDPDKMMSVNSLNEIANNKIPKFDVMGETAKGARQMAKVIESIRSGGVMTLEDARSQRQYKEAKRDFINSLIQNPNNIASVLADGDAGYGFTFNKSEAGPKTIYLRQDDSGMFTPEITPELRKAAEEIIDNAFEVQISRIETPMPTYAPQRDPGAAGAARDRQNRLSSFNMALDIVKGNETGLAAAQAVTANPNSGISNITSTDDEIVVSYTNGDERVIQKTLNGMALDHNTLAQALFNAISPGATPSDASVASKEFFGTPEGRAYQTTDQFGTFGERPAAQYRPVGQILIPKGGNNYSTLDAELRQITLDGGTAGIDRAGDVQSLLQRISPGAQVVGERNWVDKNKLIITIPELNNRKFTVNFEDPRHMAELLNEVEKINQAIFAQKNQQAEEAPATTAAGGIDYSQFN